MVNTDIDEPCVLAQVIDAIRIRPGDRRIGEVVAVHLQGCLARPPLAAFIHVVPKELLLFRVDGDNRLALRQCGFDRSVDVPELGVPVRMVVTFLRLPVALEAVVHGTEDLGYLLVADLASLIGEFRGKGSRALAGPAHRRLRITTERRGSTKPSIAAGGVPDRVRQGSVGHRHSAVFALHRGGRGVKFRERLGDRHPGQPAGP